MEAEHCGRGSVVEHHLAKVRVASSNLVARSNKPPGDRGFFDSVKFSAREGRLKSLVKGPFHSTYPVNNG